MSPVRGLISRLRGRSSAAPTTVGLQFVPAMEQEFGELTEEVDAQVKRTGTAMVASWEVAASELARVTIGMEGEKVLIDRFSDSLVPALTPFQDLHKGAATAVREGIEAGRREGSMAAATRPLVMLVHGLDAQVEPGWVKTLDYLEPIFALAKDPAAARAAMEPAGARMAAACREGEQVLRERLSKLPQATSLTEGVIEPFEAWQLVVCREIEMATYAATRGMIKEIRG